MFPSIAPEEIAFAMTLFVGAANGQAQALRRPVEQADEQSGERFFLNFAAPSHASRAAAIESPLFRAFRAVWLEYRWDERRESIAARVLGFCFLMERTRGAILHPVQLEPVLPESLVVLHPAVIEAVSAVALSPKGVLSMAAFVSALELAIPAHADLQARTTGENAVMPGAVVAQGWPSGAGEVVTLMRSRDWTAHSLGMPTAWPQSLRTSIELTVASSFPMIVLWGPDLIQFYNDAYRNIMGVKHPAGLGQATERCWPEVWDFNKPVYARVLKGESLTFEDQLFPIRRYGFLENAYFTLCYSPLRLESGAVEGVFITVFETTLRVLSSRERETEEKQRDGNRIAGTEAAARVC
jgi:PAS domain-containing protein